MFNLAAVSRPICKISIVQGLTFMSPNRFSVSSSTAACWAWWARHCNIRTCPRRHMNSCTLAKNMRLSALFGLLPTETRYFVEILCTNLRIFCPKPVCKLTLASYPQHWGILDSICTKIWEYSSQKHVCELPHNRDTLRESLCQNLRKFLSAWHRSQIHYPEMREVLNLISSKLFYNFIWQLLQDPLLQFLSLSFTTLF